MQNSLTPRYLVILVILGWSIFSIWPTIKYQNLSEENKETLREEGKLDQLESEIINIIESNLERGNIVVTIPAVLAVAPIETAVAAIPTNVDPGVYVNCSFVLKK